MSPRPKFRHRPSESAYTLFEIMLVLGIISVLVGSAIYMLSGNIDVAKEQRASSDLQALKTQLRAYEMLNYNMPTSDQGLTALVSRPTTEPAPQRWKRLLEEVPVDPWGNAYVYRNPGTKNPTSFDLFSMGADEKESQDDVWK